jgi:hypothetical protein
VFGRFPIIFVLTIQGDYLTSSKRKIAFHPANQWLKIIEKSNELGNYSFNEKWINQNRRYSGPILKTDKNFPYVSINYCRQG